MTRLGKEAAVPIPSDTFMGAEVWSWHQPLAINDFQGKTKKARSVWRISVMDTRASLPKKQFSNSARRRGAGHWTRAVIVAQFPVVRASAGALGDVCLSLAARLSQTARNRFGQSADRGSANHSRG